MAEVNVTQPSGGASPTPTEAQGVQFAYVPERTLGRSGYVPSNGDKLCIKIEHLDALLTVMSLAPEGEELEGFSNCNQSIQSAVMSLASTLAHEIHELNEERIIFEMNATSKTAAWGRYKAAPAAQ